MRQPLQDSLLCLPSAIYCRVAAECGEADKDYHNEAALQAAGGVCILLVVERLGLWSPNSLDVLKIAFRTTSKSSASPALAFCHFLEQLSIYLWRYNSWMLFHYLSLIPGSLCWEVDN